MATAANYGWPVRKLTAADLALVASPRPTATQQAAGVLTIPGAPVFVRKEVAPLFRGLLGDLQRLRASHGLSPLLSAGGYNFRPVRNYELLYRITKNPRYLSNHSWGFAVDVNVATNPMKKPVRTDFPRAETYALARKWGLSWGIDFGDPMHFEAIGTAADFRAAVARNTTTTPTITPDFLEDFMATLNDTEKGEVMRLVRSLNRTFDEKQTSKLDGKGKYWLTEFWLFQEANTSRMVALLERLVKKQGA